MSEEQFPQEPNEEIPGQESSLDLGTSAESSDVDATESNVVDQLGAELAATSRKAEENWDKLMRVQAEMENLRRRTEREVQDARKYALEKFARELLPVLDSLELGVQAASGETPEVTRLREGVELTLRQLQSVLEKFQVQVIDPMGLRFNPELHQAMAMEPSLVVEPNTVVKVFQKGYLLNDRLLRPAMVVIAQAMAQPTHLDEKA